MVTSGAFHSDTPLPASLRRPPRTPSTMLCRTREPGGAVDINAEQVCLRSGCFRPARVPRSSRGNTPESMVCRSWPDPRMVTPRIVTSGSRHGDDIAGAVADRARAPGRPVSTSAAIDPDRALVFAGCKLDDVAVLRPVQHRLQRLFRSSLQRLRDRGARSSGGEDRRRNDAQEEAHVSFPSQAVLGSTNMRPFISMCMA